MNEMLSRKRNSNSETTVNLRSVITQIKKSYGTEEKAEKLYPFISDLEKAIKIINQYNSILQFIETITEV